MSNAALTMTEGVLLAHALVARVAEQAGARVLFLKGPTATAVGVRPDRPSTDVDVLVDPVSFEDLCTGLRTHGWQDRSVAKRPLTRVDDIAFAHSAHFSNKEWPCDIDVHYNFAGFLLPAGVVFEELWADRVSVSVADREVPAPGLFGHVLVVGLHALRDPGKANSITDLGHLERLAAQRLDNAQLDLLGRLSQRTGSDVTAAPILVRMGVPSALPSPDSAAPARAWRFHQQAAGTAGVMWLAEVRRAPWRVRPKVLARAVLPSRDLLLSSTEAAQASRRTVARLHLRRWLRGLRALPRALAAVRRLPE